MSSLIPSPDIRVTWSTQGAGRDVRLPLGPDAARDSAVLPPVGQPPGDEVDAGAELGTADPHHQAVRAAPPEGVPRVQREGRAAAFVVTEVAAVEPDVAQVV